MTQREHEMLEFFLSHETSEVARLTDWFRSVLAPPKTIAAGG